jgi:SAM-dependent methyltransferase
MIRQRAASAAPAVCAVAERLPFRDGAFGAALAVLTVHHWADPAAGLDELCRVARKRIVVTWDPVVFANQFWFVRDYLPESVVRESQLPTVAAIAARLAPCRIEPLPVPADCTDGFFGAYWRRPHAYLDPDVRRAISALALLDAGLVSAAVERLRRDLADGSWLARYAVLIDLNEIDLGYRLVVAED